MNWFYKEGEKKTGPVSDAELASLVEQGKIGPDTPVWNELTGAWRPYGEVKAAAEKASGIGLAGAPKNPAANSFAITSENSKPDKSGNQVRNPQFGHHGHVLTGEGFPSESKYPKISGFWRRIFAFLLDAIILGSAGLIAGYFLFDFFAGLGPWGILIGFGVSLLYFGILDSSIGGGQTIGKRLLKIKVADAGGAPISIGMAFARFAIFGVPCFLNGAALPGLQMPLFAILDALVVFGVGGAMVYLYIFNRRTRQSLHDLAVGSFVISAKDQGKEKMAPVWKGHFALVGAWVAATLLFVTVALPRIAQVGPLPGLLSLQQEINGPGRACTTVLMGDNWTYLDGKKTETKFLQVTAAFNARPSDFKKAAYDVARIVLSKYPQVSGRDRLNIIIIYGYNIGIAHSWINENFSYSPAQWEQVLNDAQKPI